MQELLIIIIRGSCIGVIWISSVILPLVINNFAVVSRVNWGGIQIAFPDSQSHFNVCPI